MLGSIISGIGSIAGGLIGANSAKKDRKQQKEFAKKSIGWRADDAEAAGFHRLVGATGQSTQYTPVGDGGMGSAVSQAGQALGGAVSQTRSALATQMGQSSMAVDAANIELLKAQKLQILDNIRKSQVGQKGTTTSMQIPGKTTRPIIGGKPLPHDKTSSDAEAYEQRYGDIAQELGGAVTAYQDFVKPKMRMSVNKMSKSDREKMSWLQWLIPQLSYNPKGK